MKRVALALLVTAGLLHATDFSSLSTEELMQLKGSVPAEERDAFRTEMRSRMSSMSPEDRAALDIGGKRRSSYGSANGTTKRLRDGSGGGKMYQYRGSRGRGGGGRR
ncbi:MAG: hypothetical protein DSY46_03540 [Hydrogenimonas sp.]|nr:MAG: hypothetical protein DSY46_03540 [Hydrogenimonas sp.]